MDDLKIIKVFKNHQSIHQIIKASKNHQSILNKNHQSILPACSSYHQFCIFIAYIKYLFLGSIIYYDIYFSNKILKRYVR
jgi:hypothetical protein